MHLLAAESVSLDDGAEAVDLAHSPADIVFLSFTDSDLSSLAAAWAALPAPRPSLRLAPIARLRHPYSVDLYIEKTLRQARFILVRLLGGLDYWRYGIEEIAADARARGATLAVLPGDHREDTRLDAASTLDTSELRLLWRHFQAGGPENMAAVLRYISAPRAAPLAPPAATPSFGHFAAACAAASPEGPRAALIFYRSALLAGDTAPVLELSRALSAQRCRVEAYFVTSLKDPGAAAPLAEALKTYAPDVILNTTAFSARTEGGGGVLDCADAPVIQVILSGSTRDQWAASARGLRPADLAMNIVLPEIDGRIIAGAVSFKGEALAHPELEFTHTAHQPDADGVAAAAALALAHARLRRLDPARRRIACVLSDYPAKAGRAGYAVGLDTPQSVIAIAQDLDAAGYSVTPPNSGAALMEALTRGPSEAVMSGADYAAHFAALPEPLRANVEAAWGAPQEDADFSERAFSFRIARCGNLIVAVQPDRGGATQRKVDYHDANLPPRHGYIAFYLWLRHGFTADALIQCGTHGTLEWLPGKAAALSRACTPQALLGALPLIYPFIVNNPGEAAQAKRRSAALTIGHLTPPLTGAGTHGVMAEIEALLDEYANAQALDPRRAKMIARAIAARAAETELLKDSGIDAAAGEAELLTRLDAWICDVKDMRIGDGLHVFARGGADDADPARAACARGESEGLLRALAARFVQPGPAGAPERARADVLPTGRNLFTIDPRGVPTRTAWEIGARTARDVVARHTQDHGDYPRTVFIDLWGSASMRTGGEELAQALALMGVRPEWDNASSRVSGFTILPLAALAHPRIDVTLRVSGLFRDVFPAQIDLFADAVRALAALEEDGADNPLAADARAGGGLARVYSSAPGAYGTGLTRRLSEGNWTTRAELGEIWLAASAHAYEGAERARRDDAGLRARVADAQAFVHVQDMAGQDIFDADAFAEYEGGFAAAAAALGASPALYHVDTQRADAVRVRTLGEEAARVMRGRAANPRWIEGQMRHGHRGATEIANTVDQVFAFAALSDAVAAHHFDLLFDAVCGDRRVFDFLRAHNPEAARAVAERFEEALRRGLWETRRNSTKARLADLLERAP